MEIDPAETAGDMAEMRESLAESEARYRSLVLATAQMVWTADAAGQVTTERSWDEYTGSAARGEGWLAALHPDDAGHASQAWFAAVRSGAMYQAEYRLRRRDGVYRYFSARAVPVRGADGALREWVGVCVDIHDERQARQAAERAAWRTARLQAVAVALAQSLSPEQLAEVVVRESVAALEAAAGVMALLAPEASPAGDALRLVRPQGYGSEQIAGYELIPLDAPLPLAHAARAGEPVYLHDLAERDRRFPLLAAIRSPHQAWSVAPLVAEGRILGVLGLSYDRPQRFDDDDRDLIEALAGQCAQALERARLFEEARLSQLARDESLALLDTLIANAPIGMAFVDCQGRFVRVNQALARMNNRPAEEHFGRTLAEILPAVPEPIQRAFAQVLATGEPVIDVEVAGPRRLRPGQQRSWLASYYPVRAGAPAGDGRGPASGWLGVGVVVSDISERKVAEERLRFLAEATSAVSASLEPRTTIETIARLCAASLADWCMIELMDQEGATQELALAHADPAKTALLTAIHAAYPPDAATPQGSRAVLRSGASQWVPQVTAEMLRAAAKDDEHARLLAEAGMASYLCVPLLGRGRILGVLALASGQADQPFGAEDLALAEDLGRRAALAVENAQLYAAAREALITRDQFLSIAAHELKTPITTMLGYAQLIQRRAAADALPPRVQRSIQVIIEQTQRLNRLVAALLDLSRIQMGQLTIERGQVDLAALVARIVDEIAPGLERHRIMFAPAGPLPVEGDELRLEQVVQNLLQNAVKYAPDGGSIEVRLAAAAGRAALSVRDEGIGIPAEAVPLLFTRFYRARNVASQQIAGMGLGLYVVKEIVALHGGSVDVASREGAGSTFTIYLPLRQREDGAGAAGAAR
ncbi:MAG TPA: ATP-binding protein [Herpetosiphonaceae bacterium]